MPQNNPTVFFIKETFINIIQTQLTMLIEITLHSLKTVGKERTFN